MPIPRFAAVVATTVLTTALPAGVLAGAPVAAAPHAAEPPAAQADRSGDSASDRTEVISALATGAATVLAEERRLLDPTVSDPTERAPTGRDPSVPARPGRLRAVDDEGRVLLGRLDALDVELTGAIRTALDRLPPPDPLTGRAAPPPPAAVYTAAIADLQQIADAPDRARVLPGDTADRSISLGLLAITALALLALGLVALLTTLRRRPSGRELEAMAWSDGLTGLANRRRLDRDLRERDLAARRRITAPTTVIMVDVDHFKAVNDTHGHQAGDRILQAVAAMLAREVRAGDVVYRYGGEEFCILLPDTTAGEAELVGDRILRAARSIELPDGDHITVSLGLAEAPGAAIVDAVGEADRALFTAKRDGRDRTVTATPAAPTFEPA